MTRAHNTSVALIDDSAHSLDPMQAYKYLHRVATMFIDAAEHIRTSLVEMDAAIRVEDSFDWVLEHLHDGNDFTTGDVLQVSETLTSALKTLIYYQCLWDAMDEADAKTAKAVSTD